MKAFLWIKFPQPLFIVMYITMMLNEEFPCLPFLFLIHKALQMYENLMQILSAGRKIPLEIIQNIYCVTSIRAEENSQQRKSPKMSWKEWIKLILLRCFCFLLHVCVFFSRGLKISISWLRSTRVCSTQIN